MPLYQKKPSIQYLTKYETAGDYTPVEEWVTSFDPDRLTVAGAHDLEVDGGPGDAVTIRWIQDSTMGGADSWPTEYQAYPGDYLLWSSDWGPGLYIQKPSSPHFLLALEPIV